MVHNSCFWVFSEDTVVIFAGVLLSIQRGLVHLKQDVALVLRGNPCLQMSGNTAEPWHKVEDDVVIPKEGKTSEDVINQATHMHPREPEVACSCLFFSWLLLRLLLRLIKLGVPEHKRIHGRSTGEPLYRLYSASDFKTHGDPCDDLSVFLAQQCLYVLALPQSR